VFEDVPAGDCRRIVTLPAFGYRLLMPFSIANRSLAFVAARLTSLGFPTYLPNVSWARNAEYLSALQAFPGSSNYVHDRRFNLFFLAKAFAHISGDMAECGVRFGRTAHLMLTAAPGKHLYGFDSFQGLPQPKEHDGFGWAPGELASAETIAERNLEQHRGRYSLYKGWIPDRFKEVADKRFSFVHVDVDLYRPTLDSLEFFWPLLNHGGILLCDDYGSKRCPGARKALDEFAASVGQQAAELTTMQAFLVKPCGR
jgi:O-methyltransferase